MASIATHNSENTERIFLLSEDNQNNSQGEKAQSEQSTNTQNQEAENQQENTTRSKPSHMAYQVNNVENGNSYFNHIGSAFEHRDGQGYDVSLNAMPVDGKITLRSFQEKLQSKRDGNSSQEQSPDQGQER
jgi:hypothetical protein